MLSDPSPPLTPDTEITCGNRFRFTSSSIGPPCEWAEMYRPGRFHPVNLGDKFHDDMYTVVRKLGYGSSSTVWLAVDSKNKRYVALKVVDARRTSDAENELNILQFLSQKAGSDTRFEYFITLLDTFVQEGPNGRHTCLVYEPMGPSAAMMVEELPDNSPLSEESSNNMSDILKPSGYPKWMAKRILLDILRALSLLHENNIVHGGIHPGNFLFSISDINDVKVDELKHDQTVPYTMTPLERSDGKTDKWAPKNLYDFQSLQKYAKLGLDMKVKIADLQSAFWTNNPPAKSAVPVALRAPELILGQSFGMSIDIWAFGCLIFEFLIGRPLFVLMPFLDQHEKDDDHLVQLNDVLDKLPEYIIDAWPHAKEWYDPVTRRPLQTFEKYGQTVPYAYDSLEVVFAQNKPPDIDDPESVVICSLIRQILVYSPEKRPSATELLNHSWFSD